MINNDRVEEKLKKFIFEELFLDSKVNWDNGFEKSSKSLKQLLSEKISGNDSHKMALKILPLGSLIAFVHPIE